MRNKSLDSLPLISSTLEELEGTQKILKHFLTVLFSKKDCLTCAFIT